jgi:cytoskeletal protein RodZ
MTKNQKIAAGCGAAGCLGLIVLAVVGGALAYWKYGAQRSSYEPDENRNRSYSSSANANDGSNSNRNANSESTNSPSSSSAASSLSDDDKHKLFQAAGMTQDADLILRVTKKIGITKADNTPTDEYAQFVKDHISWAISNADFIKSVNTPEKARAYVNEHL